MACAKGKARCDNRSAGCGRCRAKGLECVYPVKRSGSGGASAPANEKGVNKRRRTDGPVVEHTTAGAGHHEPPGEDIPAIPTIPDPTFTFPDLDTTNFPDPNFGQDLIEWDTLDLTLPQLNDPEFHVESQSTNEAVQYPSPPDSSSVTQVSTPSPPYQQFFTIPHFPTYDRRSLIPRTKRSTGAQRTATLILNTLKSYPLMMSRNKTLPPFIHPKILELDLDDGNGKGNAMEPLANCVTLMHMIGSEVKGSRKLFWKNVRFECERLCSEVRYLIPVFSNDILEENPF